MQSDIKSSSKLRPFLKEVEGVRFKSYLDTGGVWTNGVGHTGPDVLPNQTVDIAQVDAWLEEDIAEAEGTVNRLVTVPLTQGQYDALVSFAFNIGEPQFKTSTLLKLLNAGEYAKAALQFARWNLDNGKVIPGLVFRRQKETAMFLK